MGVVDSPPAVVWRGGPTELAVGRAHVAVDGTNVGIICCINLGDGVCNRTNAVVITEGGCRLMIPRSSRRGDALEMCVVCLREVDLKLLHVLLLIAQAFHTTKT